MKQFEKILIANRGEIAVRIIRAAQKNHIHSVAVYAADDAGSLHVSMADEAVLLSGKTLADTYINQDKLIEIALISGAKAIHPGYGFLSENADFAQKVIDAGLVFIGPTPENIRLMGEKNRALDYIESLGIPVLKSFRGNTEEILRHSPEMKFPVLVKASGGGGGKGMIICHQPEELLPALQKAERQAVEYFGNGDLFVEKYLPRARHIEVQLMADHHGNVLHFYERECSVQRRFQKIIEEAPSPSVNPELREELTSTAIQIARSINYRNAGTIEFLLDENDQFYFLEMNTRIQVEHPVTEMVTNTDLVSLQLLVAAGNPLPMDQKDICILGHSIEMRLCAEDAENDFHPSTGQVTLWKFPESSDSRLETFVKEGITISPNYDSLLAKIVVCEKSRQDAISRVHEILSETCISGIHTNQSFLSAFVETPDFSENRMYTTYIDENLRSINTLVQDKKNRIKIEYLILTYWAYHFPSGTHGKDASVWNQIGFWRMFPTFEMQVNGDVYYCRLIKQADRIEIQINDKVYEAKFIRMVDGLLEMEINHKAESFRFQEKMNSTEVFYKGFSFELQSNLLISQVLLKQKNNVSEKLFQNLICADLFGRVLKINVREGDTIQAGQVLLTLESMKTEIHIVCPAEARIKKLHTKEGESVSEKQLLLELEEPVIFASS